MDMNQPGGPQQQQPGHGQAGTSKLTLDKAMDFIISELNDTKAHIRALMLSHIRFRSKYEERDMEEIGKEIDKLLKSERKRIDEVSQQTIQQLAQQDNQQQP